MTDAATGDSSTSPPGAATRSVESAEAKSRRRTDAVFGAVAPEATRDEQAEGWSEGDDDRDALLRSEVPPHHG